MLEYGFLMSKHVFIAGRKKFKQNTEKGLPTRRAMRYFCEISGMAASCTRADEVLVAGYLDCAGARK